MPGSRASPRFRSKEGHLTQEHAEREMAAETSNIKADELAFIRLVISQARLSGLRS